MRRRLLLLLALVASAAALDAGGATQAGQPAAAAGAEATHDAQEARQEQQEQHSTQGSPAGDGAGRGGGAHTAPQQEQDSVRLLARCESLLGLAPATPTAARDVPAAVACLNALAARLTSTLPRHDAAPLMGAALDSLRAEARAAFLLAALGSAPQLIGAGGPARAAGRGGAALLKFAAAANVTEAQLALADRHLMGRGLPPSCREGIRYLRLAAETVAAQVEEDGSNFHLPGAPVRLRERWSDAQAPQSDENWDDVEDVVRVEEDAAFRGDAQAQRRLGYRRLVGRGVPRDAAGAFRAFKVAADGGDAMALYNLGYMHLNGIHVPRDAAKARAYFQQAAARGLAAGHTGLGVLASEGAGGAPRNFSAARHHFEAGANGSNADAMFNLGNIYAHGLGVRRDAAAALKWYDKAYIAGHWRSPLALALLYAEGKDGIAFDCSEAERLLWQFVAERSPWGQQLRAALRALDSGRPWQALVRYLILAEQGCEVAAANAAYMLQRGRGARGGRTLQLAAQLLHRSSVLNSTSSMVDLASLLLERPDATAPGAEAAALLPPRGKETPYLDGYEFGGGKRAAGAGGAAPGTSAGAGAAAGGEGAAPGGGLAGTEINVEVSADGGTVKLGFTVGDAASAGAGGAGAAAAAAAAAEEADAATAESVALVWLERASKMGDSEASYNLAWLYQHGDGVPKNVTKAERLMATALRDEPDSARAVVLAAASVMLRAERLLAAVAGQRAASAAAAWLEWARDASPFSAALEMQQAQAPAAAEAVGQQQQPPQAQTPQQQQGQPRRPDDAPPRAARARPAARLELSDDHPSAAAGSAAADSGDGDDDGLFVDFLRALGSEKVAADDVILTVMLGALAAVMWLRNRQLNGPAAAARAAGAQRARVAAAQGQLEAAREAEARRAEELRAEARAERRRLGQEEEEEEEEAHARDGGGGGEGPRQQQQQNGRHLSPERERGAPSEGGAPPGGAAGGGPAAPSPAGAGNGGATSDGAGPPQEQQQQQQQQQQPGQAGLVRRHPRPQGDAPG